MSDLRFQKPPTPWQIENRKSSNVNQSFNARALNVKIRFWGVQGSIPNPLSGAQLLDKIKEVLRRAQGRALANAEEMQHFLNELPFPLTHTTGGNTTCFEVVSEQGGRVIVDMGTGARRLGLELMQGAAREGKADLHVLLTHCHWDHIMGFPFFMPAFTMGNRITFYGGHEYLQEALQRQAHPHSFPVPLERMGASFGFRRLREGEKLTIQDLEITCKELDHPGRSFAYRISEGDKSVVIATDAEYKNLDAESLRPYVDFYRDADVLVFDAQFSLKEVFRKTDWGHSSSFIGVEICLLANVSTLVLTHHDPAYSDDKMTDILERTEAFKKEIMAQNWPNKQAGDLKVVMGYEGMELTI
jgi:phosphoribosyl 1,2-cyclic phosphodiesterase